VFCVVSCKRHWMELFDSAYHKFGWSEVHGPPIVENSAGDRGRPEDGEADHDDREAGLPSCTTSREDLHCLRFSKDQQRDSDRDEYETHCSELKGRSMAGGVEGCGEALAVASLRCSVD